MANFRSSRPGMFAGSLAKFLPPPTPATAPDQTIGQRIGLGSLLLQQIARRCYGPPPGPVGVTAQEMTAQAKANAAEASQHSPLDLGWFKHQAQDSGPWDYKRYDPAFQDFGNYNYGYAGEAQGIPARLLYDAAGAAQVWDHTSSKYWFRSNWDDPRDQEQIKRGISDRRNGC